MGIPGAKGIEGYPGPDGVLGLTGLPGLPGKRGRQVPTDVLRICYQNVTAVVLLLSSVYMHVLVLSWSHHSPHPLHEPQSHMKT